MPRQCLCSPWPMLLEFGRIGTSRTDVSPLLTPKWIFNAATVLLTSPLALAQIQTYSVLSWYQPGPSRISVLLPRSANPPLRVVYILPVEPGAQVAFGDPLKEIERLGLNDKYGVAFVKPEFHDAPWYGDHPVDLRKRQESHFLDCVMPYVTATLPVVNTKEGTFLVGFSKSGWGAFSLALRHPDRFEGIAVWDAPLMQTKPIRWEMPSIFGTQENFDKYRIDLLLRAAGSLPDLRIVLLGYGLFRSDVVSAHELMQSLDISHTFRDGPKRVHRWDSGWLREAIEILLET